MRHSGYATSLIMLLFIPKSTTFPPPTQVRHWDWLENCETVFETSSSIFFWSEVAWKYVGIKELLPLRVPRIDSEKNYRESRCHRAIEVTIQYYSIYSGVSVRRQSTQYSTYTVHLQYNNLHDDTIGWFGIIVTTTPNRSSRSRHLMLVRRARGLLWSTVA